MLFLNGLKISFLTNQFKSPAVKQLGFCILLVSFIFSGCASSDAEKFAGCPAHYTEVQLTPKFWKTEYTGNPNVFRDGLIYLEPRRVFNPQHTDASLVLSRFDIVSDNYDIIVDYKNLVALRSPNPNPWEVFWLMFNYVPAEHGEKTANYIVAKPNGIEMGRAAKLVDQAYIKTTESPKAGFNEWHRLRVHRIGDAVKIYFNEQFVFEVSSNQIFTAAGKIGLYSEDAAVMVKRVCLNSAAQRGIFFLKKQ